MIGRMEEVKKEARRKRFILMHQNQLLQSENMRGQHHYKIETLHAVWEEIIEAFHAHTNLKVHWLKEK